MLARGIAIDATTLSVLIVVFIATLIRSTFGFGEALVAVPLLALWIPLNVAAPLAVLVSITIAAIIVVQDWQKIHLRSTGWLVLSTLFGIPLGLLLLTSSHQRMVKGALGLIIIGFAIYFLIGRTPLELKEDSRLRLLICGFCAGVLGGAYGMNGPPLAIYGSMRRWSAQHFRATLQGYFPACQHHRNVRLLGCGTLDLRGNALLLALPAGHADGHMGGQSHQPSPAWGWFSEVRLPGLDRNRSALTDAGHYRPALIPGRFSLH